MTVPKLVPDQRIGLPPSHAGRNAALVYVAGDQLRKERAYRKFVGPEYASVTGFFIWKSQYYPLLRQQPRVNVARGLLFAGASAVLYLMANIPGIGPIGILFFGALFLASLFYGISQFRHQTPPAADLQAIYDWHKAYAVNRGAPAWKPGDISGRLRQVGSE